MPSFRPGRAVEPGHHILAIITIHAFSLDKSHKICYYSHNPIRIARGLGCKPLRKIRKSSMLLRDIREEASMDPATTTAIPAISRRDRLRLALGQTGRDERRPRLCAAP